MEIPIAPMPSRYIPHSKVEEIATACNKAYRSKCNNSQGYPVDVEAFIDLCLFKSIIYDDIEEPDGTIVFASYSQENDGIITINDRHRALFEKRPDILRSCIGHEAGHCILRHHEHDSFDENTLSLFSMDKPKLQRFHRSSWSQYGLTPDEIIQFKRQVEQLRQLAAISEPARRMLEQIEDRLEPDWMFRQAEHFSMCLLIPADQLSELITEIRFDSWPPIYRLAETFGVSISMMRVRLEKLNMLKIGSDGKPYPDSKLLQQSLF
ncbi:MAG: hypothetical protein AB1489_12495 [Acidobacteriota bacterium]